MASPDRQSKPDINRTEQGVLNWSFDEAYKVLAAMQLTEDTTAGTAKRMPTPFIDKAYDAQNYANSTSTTDVIEYYSGGLGGTKVATVTITYTDSNKSTITSIVKT